MDDIDDGDLGIKDEDSAIAENKEEDSCMDGDVGSEDEAVVHIKSEIAPDSTEGPVS
jgi:hypothetical protein